MNEILKEKMDVLLQGKKCALHFLDKAEIHGQSPTVPLHSIFQI